MVSLREAGVTLLILFLCCLPTAPIGALARHAARNQPKGWKVTVYSGIFSVLFCWIAFSANTHGDMTLGLLGYAVAGFSLGAAVYSLVFWVCRRFRNAKISSIKRMNEQE